MFDAGKIVKAMKTLSSNSGEFPSDYWLDGVICGGDPVACGGYGDIYKGDWHGTSVAVKFVKCYQPEKRRNAADNARRHKVKLAVISPSEHLSYVSYHCRIFVTKSFSGTDYHIPIYCLSLGCIEDLE